MAKLNVYIPDDLKTKMDAAGDGIKWSKVVRPAINAALKAYETRVMKFQIAIIAQDDGWRKSQGATAMLQIEVEGTWLALKPEDADRLAEFIPTVLREINITDERGIAVRYCPRDIEELRLAHEELVVLATKARDELKEAIAMLRALQGPAR